MRNVIRSLSILTVLVVCLTCSDDDGPVGPVDNVAPSTINDLWGTSYEDGSVTLYWTAPGDDSTSGRAAAYDIRVSTQSITVSNWEEKPQPDNIPTPSEAGATESLTISPLLTDRPYYFGIAALDEAGNHGGYSFANPVMASPIDDTTDTVVVDSYWTVVLGNPGNEGVSDVVVAADNSIYVAGRSQGTGGGDWSAYVVKLSPAGDVRWERTLGGAADDEGRGVAATDDGGCLVAGLTQSYGEGGEDGYLIRLDDDGSVLWARTFGGAGNDWLNGVATLSDGTIGLVGTNKSSALGFPVAWPLHLDAAGSVLWEDYWYSASAPGCDAPSAVGTAVEWAPDGGMILRCSYSSWPSWGHTGCGPPAYGSIIGVIDSDHESLFGGATSDYRYIRSIASNESFGLARVDYYAPQSRYIGPILQNWTGAEVASIDPPSGLVINGLAFLSDGRLVVVGYASGAWIGTCDFVTGFQDGLSFSGWSEFGNVAVGPDDRPVAVGMVETEDMGSQIRVVKFNLDH